MSLLPIASGAVTRRLLVSALRGQRLPGLVGLAALVGAAALSLVTAPLLGDIVDLAVVGDGDAVPGRVLVLALAALGQGALAFAGLALVALVGERVLAALREGFVAAALDLPLERVEEGGSGDLTSRVTEDVAMVSDAVRTAFPDFARSALVIALTVVGLAALDWRFGAAALLAVPVQWVTARWYLARSGPLYAEQRVAGGAEQQQLLDSVGGVSAVRAFGLADAHVDKVAERVDRSVGLTIAVTLMQTRFFGRLNLAEVIGLFAVLTTGFFLVDAGAVTLGEASAAALYFVNLFGPINAVLFLLDTLQSATASLSRIVGVVETSASEPEGDPVTVAGGVRTTALRYAYTPGTDVLHGVAVNLPEGSVTALVGASGSGKTTLAKLLAGVHTPTTGAVTIGGADLTTLNGRSLRKAVVLVTQEVHVFAGTVADDLRLAKPEATEEELLAVLKTVGALDWVQALPEAMETVVGAGGRDLTPVQAQHLALARLVLADPKVAVLDEATAEAGSGGSKTLEAATAAALKNRTAVVVAHRLTQAAAADTILVLDNGRIVEQGPHQALLNADGDYARLWSAWSATR